MKKILCPICDRTMDGQGPGEWPDWPFCSKRCKMVDLGRWLGGAYAIGRPAKEEELELSDEISDAYQSADSPEDNE